MLHGSIEHFTAHRMVVWETSGCVWLRRGGAKHDRNRMSRDDKFCTSTFSHEQSHLTQLHSLYVRFMALLLVKLNHESVQWLQSYSRKHAKISAILGLFDQVEKIEFSFFHDHTCCRTLSAAAWPRVLDHCASIAARFKVIRAVLEKLCPKMTLFSTWTPGPPTTPNQRPGHHDHLVNRYRQSSHSSFRCSFEWRSQPYQIPSQNCSGSKV